MISALLQRGKPRTEALNVDQPFVGGKFRPYRICFLFSSVSLCCIILPVGSKRHKHIIFNVYNLRTLA